jgi:hypothetical protein
MAGEIVNRAALHDFLHDPNGPVAAEVERVGQQLRRLTIARLKVGFPRNWLGRRVVAIRTDGPEGPSMLVGSDDTKTSPHVIPKGGAAAGRTLVFFWPAPKGPGKVVFFRSVNHPGSNFDKYLSRKLLEALAELKEAI